MRPPAWSDAQGAAMFAEAKGGVRADAGEPSVARRVAGTTPPRQAFRFAGNDAAQSRNCGCAIIPS